ncbi:MAG TPA: flagellar biosynthetic protein FliO [Bryobacteraceae bacterium]|nr:flagellar biosynthetic protein FliO [Bryobacteraceae bacterium]HPT27925.1 flagellar biosynthetic protein FliO [Bryobacteraceae bacterium]
MYWTEQLLAVAFVFLLLGGAVWALGRRRGGLAMPVWRRGPGKQTLINCLARLPLTSQHMLHLVQVGDRTVLIATHPGGVVLESQGSPFQFSLASALDQERAK